MKKIFNKSIIACVAAGMALGLASCHSGGHSEAPVFGTPVVETPELAEDETTREIVFVVNQNPNTLKFTIDGQVVSIPAANIVNNGDGTWTVTYVTPYKVTDSKKSVSVKVEGKNGEYVEQDFNVAFGENSTSTATVNLAKASAAKNLDTTEYDATTGTTQQDIVVTNDAENESSNGDATYTIPASTTITNTEDGTANDGQGFSITVYEPATTPDANVDNVIESVSDEGEQTEQTAEADLSVLAVRCTPNGVTFSEPVKIKVAVPGASEGFQFNSYLKGTSEAPKSFNKVAGEDAVEIEVDHFSDWVIDTKGELAGVLVSPDPLKSGSYTNGSASATTIKGTYKKKTGAKIVNFEGGTPSTAAQKLILLYLKAQLGAVKGISEQPAESKEKSASFTVGGWERLEWGIYQTYKEMRFRFPGTSYVAVVHVYGNVRTNKTRTPITPGSEVETSHVGGSN